MNIDTAQIIQSLIAPLSIAIAGWWVKSQLKKVDQISNILTEIKYIKEKLFELKTNVENFKDVERGHILLEREVKAAWSKVDEIAADIKDMRT